MVSPNALHSADPGKVETTVSEACTRSGAFALLLAVVLFLLAMYWIGEKRDEAAAEYVGYRIFLAMYLDTLHEDRVWQEYENAHPDAENMPMSQLLHLQINVSTQVAPNPQSAEPDKTATSQKTNPLVAAPARPTISAKVPKPGGMAGKASAPAAPTGLTGKMGLVTELYEMVRIQEFLGRLNDSQLLTRAREASNFFAFSIVKWVQKRSATMYANALIGVCQPSVLELPRRPHESAQYTPQIDTKAMYECLTLRNVRDLAKFELPAFTNPSSMGRRVAQDVDLSPGSLPRDPYMATIVAQILLFLVLTYFTVFTHEAVDFESFPASGTLFGAFSTTSWSRVVFFLALWTPFMACCAVLIASRKPLLAIGIIPVALVTLSSQRTLERATFFGRLKPLSFIEGKFKSRWHRTKGEHPMSK